ncbi:MFS transporter [Arthrobacter sulfonylureivorans]|uniref:MFS transporter n=1 Tax=Arthrobacter sulfonylureivorans TaxID=2486855 RepID=A0ABY3W7W5_9MICC|nr:MFS transporter [Arthrobacter sulfonylureivorans]UNK46086.1 MFS transporter [Arthrobacter sulfonylureivorans]
MTTSKSAERMTDYAARKERRRAQGSSFLGSVVEAYDFLLYASAAALVFPRVMFTGMDPALGTTLAFVTLLAGYLARPLGGLLFGHFGDRIGRKPMLFISVLVMGVVSLAIGLMPTNLGPVISGVILTGIRVIQGIVVGGEWSGATLMSMEHSSKRNKGFGASIAVSGGPAGSVLATLVLGIFVALPEEQFLTWGWRVPFLLSIVVVAVAVYLRYRVSESPEFKAAAPSAVKQKAPLLRVLRDSRGKILLGILVALAPLFLQVMLTSFMISHLAGRSAGLAGEGVAPAITVDALLFMITAASAVGVLTIPLVGWLSDRIGRNRMLVAGAVLGMIGVWPMMALFSTNDPFLIGLGFMLGLPVMQVSMLGVLGAFLAELFETTTRYTGLSLTFQVGAAIGGGTAPLVAQYLGQAGGGGLTLIAVYYCLLACVAAAAVLIAGRHQPIRSRETASMGTLA